VSLNFLSLSIIWLSLFGILFLHAIQVSCFQYFLRRIIFLTWDRPSTFNPSLFPSYLYLKIKNHILRSDNLSRYSVFHTASTRKIIFCSPLDLKIKLSSCPVQVKAVTSCVVVMSVSLSPSFSAWTIRRNSNPSLKIIHSAVQRFPDWIFYRFPTNAIYWDAMELRSWNRFLQECKLALV